jgi:zona occludens toxin
VDLQKGRDPVIELITGAPGAGKSYAAVRRIVQSVRENRPVVTNVPLAEGWADKIAKGVFRSKQKEQELAARYRRLVLIREELPDLLKVRLAGEGEGRGDMVIDESQRWIDSREWDTAVEMSRDEAIRKRQELNRFFQTHRHYGYNVYLITQHEGNLDKRVVRLFEYLTEVKNLRNVKVLGFRIFPMNLFVAVTVWNDRVHSKCKTAVYGLDKTIAGLYHTHALAAVALGDDELLHPEPLSEPT